VKPSALNGMLGRTLRDTDIAGKPRYALVNVCTLTDADGFTGIKGLLSGKNDIATRIAVSARKFLKRHKENAVFVIHGLLGRDMPLPQKPCATIRAMPVMMPPKA
jgi:hypothetical protein